jgi:hypothetical protein
MKSVSERRAGREEDAIYGAAKHRVLEESGSRCGGSDVCAKTIRLSHAVICRVGKGAGESQEMKRSANSMDCLAPFTLQGT